jgi:hypothetical protein
MKPEFGLTDQLFNTSFAPLCVLGSVIGEGGQLNALRNFKAISAKKGDHTPGEKLLDAFLLILAGYPSLYLLNTTLRPDPILAQAWGRTQLAEQSSISRTLDSCQEVALAELRNLSWQFWSQHTQLADHDWRKPLILDLDLTPLPASAQAEASTRGYLGKKTKRDAN